MARVGFVLGVVLLGPIVIFAGTVTPAHAIQCGDVLGPGGQFQLQQDLDCSSLPPPLTDETALTVKDGAILDLNGHIVTCGSSNVKCVVLTGAGTQLFDGVLRGGMAVALSVEGTGGHTVRNVTSLRGEDQIGVTSD